ncbi:NADH dehydrogenase subunit 6 [Iris pallida]|uniref:NADH dehydrogenase subunit 6 (Plastid) n=1 Tax=Iris pallida TaxID=29817 RepID=A0AAX6FR97_IRIPA|nr:NADH dehydrogenase subunit 6 [Iris pallida]
MAASAAAIAIIKMEKYLLLIIDYQIHQKMLRDLY